MHIASSNPKWYVIVKDAKYYTHFGKANSYTDNLELANAYKNKAEAEGIAKHINADIKPIY